MMKAGKSLELESGLEIPGREIEVRTSRSGGPGGQHVNKVETSVEVRWDIVDSEVLTPAQKTRIRKALGHRLVGDRVLTVRSRAERSQTANKRRALERLARLVGAALEPIKPRRATRPTKSSHEERLRAKKKRGETKRHRGRPALED